MERALDTSIQRPPLLSGCGHLFAVASVLFIWFFTSIKRPANYLSKRNGDRWYKVITDIIIQQARAMPIYGQKAMIVICNRYPAIYVDRQDSSEILKAPHNNSYSRYKKRFVDNLLNNKIIILLNLAEYRLILANSAYGLVG